MRRLFEFKSGKKPFLAPLGTSRRLPSLSRQTFERMPPAAAPLAVTVIGGLALIVVLGTFLSRGANNLPPPQTAATAEAPATSTAQMEETSAVAGVPDASEIEPDWTTAASDDGAALAGGTPIITDPTPNLPETPAGAFTPPEPIAPDNGQTAAIPRVTPDFGMAEPDVAVAETEAEIEALEALQRMEVEADLGEGPAVVEPGVAADEETAAIAPEPAATMRAATTNQYVNMRAGPDDDAEVLVVVPAQAAVQAEADCGWCAVTYDGRTGYVYRSFLSYAD